MTTEKRKAQNRIAQSKIKAGTQAKLDLIIELLKQLINKGEK